MQTNKKVDYIGLKSFEVILFFLVALIGIVPGTQLGAFVTHCTNPKDSWRLSLTVMAIITVGGAFGLKPGTKVLAFVWGLLIGITLGWHYPTVRRPLLLDNARNVILTSFLLSADNTRRVLFSRCVYPKDKIVSFPDSLSIVHRFWAGCHRSSSLDWFKPG
jgi:hypothetical protein